MRKTLAERGAEKGDEKVGAAVAMTMILWIFLRLSCLEREVVLLCASNQHFSLSVLGQVFFHLFMKWC